MRPKDLNVPNNINVSIFISVIKFAHNCLQNTIQNAVDKLKLAENRCHKLRPKEKRFVEDQCVSLYGMHPVQGKAGRDATLCI